MIIGHQRLETPTFMSIARSIGSSFARTASFSSRRAASVSALALRAFSSSNASLAPSRSKRSASSSAVCLLFC